MNLQQTELSGEVTPRLLKSFLDIMTKRLKPNSDWVKDLLAIGDAARAASTPQEQIVEQLEAKLQSVYESLWVSLGIAAKAGLDAHANPKAIFDKAGRFTSQLLHAMINRQKLEQRRCDGAR